MVLKMGIFIFLTSNINLIFCESNNGGNKKLDVNINKNQDKVEDLLTCLSDIGQSPFNSNHNNESDSIWASLKKIYGGPNEVPKECFKHMAWALKGIPAADFLNMTIDNIELIEVVGESHGLSIEQMSAITERIRLDWANKTPKHYSEFDLIALKQILCFFTSTEISEIHPDAYKNAAKVIGTLRNCNPEILAAFAKLAKLAFGELRNWSKFDIDIIGVVVTGLQPEELAIISPDLIQMIYKKYN